MADPVLPIVSPLPVYSEQPIAGVPGSFSNAWYKWFVTAQKLLSAIKASMPKTQSVALVEQISGFIETPAAKDYTLVEKIPYAATILLTTTKASAGTGTATFKINATPLGGSANAIGTTQQDQSQGSANTMAAGDRLLVTVSGVSGLQNFAFTVKYTRTISQLGY